MQIKVLYDMFKIITRNKNLHLILEYLTGIFNIYVRPFTGGLPH